MRSDTSIQIPLTGCCCRAHLQQSCPPKDSSRTFPAPLVSALSRKAIQSSSLCNHRIGQGSRTPAPLGRLGILVSLLIWGNIYSIWGILAQTMWHWTTGRKITSFYMWTCRPTIMHPIASQIQTLGNPASNNLALPRTQVEDPWNGQQ